MARSLGLSVLIGSCAFLVAATADAAGPFNVSSNAPDGRDAHRGDGVCADSNGVCTVRAAIEEANANVGMEIINIPAGTYKLDPLTGGATNPIRVFDSVFIVGAGASTTAIDGGKKTSLLEVRTVETFVLDTTRNSVESFRYDGSPNHDTVVSPGSGGLNMPVYMSVSPGTLNDDNGDLLVATSAAGVLRYNGESGAFVGTLIPPTVNGTSFVAGGISTLYDSRAEDGLYASNSLPGGNIHRFDVRTGAPVGTFIPGNGTDQFGQILWDRFAGDVSPNLLAIVSNQGVIRRYKLDGTLVGTFVSVPTPKDMLIRGGTLFVTSESTDAIYKFDAQTGASLGFFVPGGDGHLDGPTVLGADPNGDITVVSKNTNQVLRYDGVTGAFLSVAAQGGTSSLGTVGAFAFTQGRRFGHGPVVDIFSISLTNGFLSFGHTAGLTVAGGASVQVRDGVFSNNESRQYGGGIGNFGVLSLRRVAVTGNTLPTAGTGGQTSRGGGIYNAGHLSIEDALIANNFGGRGGGIFNIGDVTILNSTISNNTSNAEGGGIGNAPGAIPGSGAISMSFTTIRGNHTNDASGTDSNSFGGGIFNGTGGYIYAGNTAIAENGDNRDLNNAQFSPDCYSPEHLHFVSNRNNFVGILNANCEFLDQFFGDGRDIQSGTPGAPLPSGLGSLANNGGTTMTHLPAPGSPLIDKSLGITSDSFFTCGGLAFPDYRVDHDQRLQPRPLDGNSDGDIRCDIGAVEARPATANDTDADGIDNAIDPDPTHFTASFSYIAGGTSTHGSIVSTGEQQITITAAPGSAGVIASAAPRGGAGPAVISACGGEVTVQLAAGQSANITCVTAKAGPDQILECVSGGVTPATLDGSASSAAGGPPSFLWSVPGMSLTNANQSVASGGFPVGTKTATLTVTRGSETATDSALVTVLDRTPPVLLVPPDVTASSCTAVTLGQAVAADTCGGSVTIVNNAPATFKAGVFTITWRAIDQFGNETVKTQRVTVGLGDSSACCPAGTNVITGTTNNDTLNGTSGNDCIIGRGGQDTINGLGGNDFISGGDGIDVIDGGAGNDFIDGGPGQDTLRGGAGNDTLVGMDGDDQCFGGDNDDTIRGGQGQDHLFGENGDDTLFGDDGDDTLDGGAGNDLLNGGGLHDQCAGGTGTNTFQLCQNQPGSFGPLAASFAITSSSNSNFCASLTASNPTTNPASRWGVTFSLLNATITSRSNGLFQGATGTVTVVPSLSGNQTIAAGANNTSISFCASRAFAGSPAPSVISTQATF